MTGNEEKIRADYAALTQELIRRQLTITTMESATGGMIASLITDTEGSSAVLRGAFVTYSNEAKIHCGVPAETIETFGVYSKETAMAMALAAKDAYSADIAIGVTGTFSNPDPANADSIPGRVYFAIDVCGTRSVRSLDLPACPDRHTAKLCVAAMVLDRLRETLDSVRRDDKLTFGKGSINIYG